MISRFLKFAPFGKIEGLSRFSPNIDHPFNKFLGPTIQFFAFRDFEICVTMQLYLSAPETPKPEAPKFQNSTPKSYRISRLRDFHSIVSRILVVGILGMPNIEIPNFATSEFSMLRSRFLFYVSLQRGSMVVNLS
jgi:hypothetical protein